MHLELFPSLCFSFLLLSLWGNIIRHQSQKNGESVSRGHNGRNAWKTSRTNIFKVHSQCGKRCDSKSVQHRNGRTWSKTFSSLFLCQLMTREVSHRIPVHRKARPVVVSGGGDTDPPSPGLASVEKERYTRKTESTLPFHCRHLTHLTIPNLGRVGALRTGMQTRVYKLKPKGFVIQKYE